METQVFPKQLCGTEVRVGGVAAGLLYAAAHQVNFKMPQEVSLQGTTQVQVSYRGQPGPAVSLPLTDKPNLPSSRQLVDDILSQLQEVKWNSFYRPLASCPATFMHPNLGDSLAGAYACLQSTGGVVAEKFYFPVGAASPAILLRRADFRLTEPYPALDAEVEQLLQQKLNRLYGPGVIPKDIYEIGVHLPNLGRSWTTNDITLFLHRNRLYIPSSGVHEGVILIAISRETLDERERALRVEEAFRSTTLLSQPVLQADLEKELGSLYLKPGKRPPTEPERDQAEHRTAAVLLKMLQAIPESSPSKRAALLVAADDVTARLGGLLVVRSTQNGSEKLLDAPDLESIRKQLEPYGIRFTGPGHYSGEYEYNRGLLLRAWKEHPAELWGQRAFLMLQQMSCSGGLGFQGPETFRDLITQGEAFLSRYPETPFLKEQLYHLALSHETAWSLGQAGPQGVFAEGSRVGKAEGERARVKAIEEYEKLFRIAPESAEAISGQLKLPRLKLKLDTGTRRYFCIGD